MLAQGRTWPRRCPHNPLAQGDQNSNPLYASVYNKRTDRGTRFVGGASVRYTPLDWLNLEAERRIRPLDRDLHAAARPRLAYDAVRTGTSSGFIGNGNDDDDSITTSLSAAANRTFFSDLNATFTTRYQYGDQTMRDQDLSGIGIVCRPRDRRCGDDELRDFVGQPDHPRHGHVRRRRSRLQGSLHPRRTRSSRRKLALRSRQPLADVRPCIGGMDRVARAVVAGAGCVEPVQAPRIQRNNGTASALQRAVRDIHDRNRRNADAAHARKQEPQARDQHRDRARRGPRVLRNASASTSRTPRRSSTDRFCPVRRRRRRASRASGRTLVRSRTRRGKRRSQCRS